MKFETRDEYEKQINLVIDYINAHLYENPDIKKLSTITQMSEFHLHRVFKLIIGENIGEFTLRLRMEDVAQCLRMTNRTLDDIAFEKGYANKSVLSRAFKKFFGITPSQYKMQPQNIKFFANANKNKTTNLTPEIRNIKRKHLVYNRIIDTYGSPKSYYRAWKELGEYAFKNNLVDSDTEFIGLSFDDPTITQTDNCRFYACFTTKEAVKPKGKFGYQTIEEGLYAVFLLKGSYRGLLDIYFDIYINWLPNSKYKLRRMYSFEMYLNSPTKVAESELLTEIFVPIKESPTKTK